MNILKSRITQIIFKLGLFLAFCLIFFSSIVNLYEKRNKIFKFINTKSTPQYEKKTWKQRDLAKDIISNGGYILLFRHAEREKWIDVKKYDSIEVLNNLNAENEYFSKAVCLSDRGLVQARAIGELIEKIKLPYHIVVSSPSCRARQTAEFGFGGYDYIRNIFMHYGPYYEDKNEMAKKVKSEILKIELKENSNAIISAHNGVVRTIDIFDRIDKKIDFSNIAKKFMEEGGFIVMKNDNGKLVFVDLFYSFHKFYSNLFERPQD
jgi:broad specificity phosphatase PhoE